MSNTQKYKKAFIEGLGVDEKIITDKLKYNDIFVLACKKKGGIFECFVIS